MKMKRWLAAALPLIFLAATADAAPHVPPNIYEWVQSSARANYFFNKRVMHYELLEGGVLNPRVLIVPTLQTYDDVAIADVVSFPTNDSLRGPDGAILLCKKELAPQMDAAVANTGHISLHMNHLAALGFALHAATQPRFRAYGEQVLANSRALAAALKERGINLLAGGTETHLILAAPAAGVDITATVHALGRMGIYVKRDKIPTMRPEILLSALRLSTLNPTTRGLKEADMPVIADILARTLSGKCPAEEEDAMRMKIAKLLMDKPVFSEEWMNDAFARIVAPSSDTGSVHEHAASERKSILKHLFQ